MTPGRGGRRTAPEIERRILASPTANENNMILESIRIVLVETTHSGNIGAAARAMGNMAMDQLYLVQPKDFPSDVATARASGADYVLDSAVVCESLDEALNGCVYVIGSTARTRESNWPVLDPGAMAVKLLEQSGSQSKTVALVFGRERSGLTNRELDRCDALVTVPVNPDYPSLNLGAAVMLLCWELRKRALETGLVGLTKRDQSVEAPAEAQDMEHFFTHLEALLTRTGFIKFDRPEKLMRKIRRLFLRSRPTSDEISLLRGILKSFQFNLK